MKSSIASILFFRRGRLSFSNSNVYRLFAAGFLIGLDDQSTLTRSGQC